MSLEEDLAEMQAFMTKMKGVAPHESERTLERVAIPVSLWARLEWLEDGPLTEALAEAAVGGYAEGEEEGDSYVFYCYGLSLPQLRTVVDSMVNQGRRSFEVTIEAAPEIVSLDQQVSVSAS